MVPPINRLNNMLPPNNTRFGYLNNQNSATVVSRAQISYDPNSYVGHGSNSCLYSVQPMLPPISSLSNMLRQNNNRFDNQSNLKSVNVVTRPQNGCDPNSYVGHSNSSFNSHQLIAPPPNSLTNMPPQNNNRFDNQSNLKSVSLVTRPQNGYDPNSYVGHSMNSCLNSVQPMVPPTSNLKNMLSGQFDYQSHGNNYVGPLAAQQDNQHLKILMVTL